MSSKLRPSVPTQKYSEFISKEFVLSNKPFQLDLGAWPAPYPDALQPLHFSALQGYLVLACAEVQKHIKSLMQCRHD